MKEILKNKKLIIFIFIILFFLGIYIFLINKDEGQIFSYEMGIDKQENDNNKKEDIKIIEEKNKIIIHISGSVINEGIIEIEENSRISDAIEKAGGLKDDADLSQINLAYILADGMKIFIPSKNDNENKIINNTENHISKESGVSTIKETDSEKNIIIDINTADKNELAKLQGIGDAMAQRIIDYRKENGKFNSIDELKNVKGIGDSKFEKIKNNIKVK